MNHIVNLGFLFFVLCCISDMYTANQLQKDIPEESFLVHPSEDEHGKKQKKKISIYDVARAARDLNKETARLMVEVADVNECAGDCVSDVFEGPLAKANRETLRNIYGTVTELTAHIRKEREDLKNSVSQLRKICSLK